MATYKVLDSGIEVHHEGRIYSPGQTLELPPILAAIHGDSLELVPDPQPEPVTPPAKLTEKPKNGAN